MDLGASQLKLQIDDWTVELLYDVRKKNVFIVYKQIVYKQSIFNNVFRLSKI